MSAACVRVLLQVLTLLTMVLPLSATTWYVRPDGGTRHSLKAPRGQCDGLADTAYPGTGTNQHCAFNDVRFMYMDGTYGNSAWVMAGGDTLVIRGCAAATGQQNPDAPRCRIGQDTATGGGICQGVNAFWGCSMPPPPSGTAGQHTQILGGCAFGTYTCHPVTGYPYTGNNLTQLFGGFNVGGVLYLSGSKYVDVEGIEVTQHSGNCTVIGGTGSFPGGCSTDRPVADFAKWGIITTNSTANILLQDVYVHGLAHDGITGPIGGPFTLTRVNISFNAFAGWNFDDGVPTADAPGSTITQSYVTMIGNGCLEEYPITHSQFPAKACWDIGSGGFGDAWSGQNTVLDSFTCDHCTILYNVKDAALGPHTLLKNLRMTNSTTIGNMGQQEKWGMTANSTAVFENNLIVGNCNRMSQQLPGAAQNFNQSTGQPGSNLSVFCRASGDLFAFFSDANSTVLIANNTIVATSNTVFDLGCTTAGACGSSPYMFTNNIFLGYTQPTGPLFNGSQPGLFYLSEPSVVVKASNNIQFGVRNGSACGQRGILCLDPHLVNEPPQQRRMNERSFDNFDPHPSSGSQANGHGVPVRGLSSDFYGSVRPNPPSIGAAELNR